MAFSKQVVNAAGNSFGMQLQLLSPLERWCVVDGGSQKSNSLFPASTAFFVLSSLSFAGISIPLALIVLIESAEPSRLEPLEGGWSISY